MQSNFTWAVEESVKSFKLAVPLLQIEIVCIIVLNMTGRSDSSGFLSVHLPAG